MGGDAVRAAEEGRAFVNRRRAAPGDLVREGDEVAVWSARRDEGGAPSAPQVEVLARWGEIVVASKPAELPTTPDRRGSRSLVTELAALLGLRAAPHAASRLDVGVSGAVLCTTGPRGQRHVAAMREAGRIGRVYVGVARGTIQGEGAWNEAIGWVRGAGGRAVPATGGAEAKAAVTRYQAIARAGGAGGATAATLLRIEPITGRMHQIRVHAASAGAPLLGDREHGGARTVTSPGGRVVPVPRIALHALAVQIPGEQGAPEGAANADSRPTWRRAVAPIPEDLKAIWKALDGDEAAWDEVAVEPR
jgi:23S rRNA-/tRNA-specific pseudouridylate synthase